MSRKANNKNEEKKSHGLGTTEAIDYTRYHMNSSEVGMAFAIGFGVGLMMTYLLLKKIPAGIVVGIITGLAYIKPYKKVCIKKRKENLLLQFRDLMESLVSSYSVGNNTERAFLDAYNDIVNTFGEESDMAKETAVINAGLVNGYSIEALLMNLAERSGLEDIRSFAEVFVVSNLNGADKGKIVYDTRALINDKIEMEGQMQAELHSSKQELTIMIIMPVIIELIMDMDKSMSAGNDTAGGLIARFVAVFMFAMAYIWGNKMVGKVEKLI